MGFAFFFFFNWLFLPKKNNNNKTRKLPRKSNKLKETKIIMKGNKNYWLNSSNSNDLPLNYRGQSQTIFHSNLKDYIKDYIPLNNVRIFIVNCNEILCNILIE